MSNVRLGGGVGLTGTFHGQDFFPFPNQGASAPLKVLITLPEQ